MTSKSNPLIPLVKIDSMTSIEIADLLDARHDSVKRSVERLVNAGVIHLPPMVEDKGIQGHSVKCYILPKRDTFVVVAQMSPAFTGVLVDRWQYLEEQLEILKFRQSDKRQQLDAMEALRSFLPEDLKGEALSYIKANTIVNKAVSNLFYFPKVLKKSDMSMDMLAVREHVLDDYIKLYEVIEDNTEVKKLLYAKYQPNRITGPSHG